MNYKTNFYIEIKDQGTHTSYNGSHLQGVPEKMVHLACCYSRANAPFFLGHPVVLEISSGLYLGLHSMQSYVDAHGL